jgi:hypothetical protein
MNDNVIKQLSEFINGFATIQLTPFNLNDNIIVIRTFYEIILNLLYNLEYPGKLILMLLRADGNETFNKINESYHIYKETNKGCDNTTWDSYFILYENICKVLDKFKTAILAEGSSLKFSQDSEVIHINISY